MRKSVYNQYVLMKKKRTFRFDPVVIVWVIVIFALSLYAYSAVARLVKMLPKETTEQKFAGSVKRQGSWFIQNQKPEGNFVYEQYSATGEETENNNIVRQAGALYGLGHIYRFNKDPYIGKAFERSLTYFQRLTATVGAEMAAITHEDATFTNTTALVVLGLVEYMEADEQKKTTENLEYLVRLSNYLVSTQTPEGAYIHTYTPEPSESDYTNGEAMYALIRSYNLTQKEAYLSSVKKMADYAIGHYGAQTFHASFFSWSMAAFSYLYAVSPDEKYWKYMASSIDAYFEARGNMYEKYLTDKEKYTPISPGSSVFLEGVNHVGWIAKEKDPVLYRKLQRHIQNVLEYLLLYEINSPYGKYKSVDTRVSGAVCAKADCQTTRIDFMQHNISALYLYLRFFK